MSSPGAPLKRKTLATIWILLLLALGTTQAADQLLVKYLSAEHVYVSGGQADGLAVGARLIVLGPQGIKAELEVIFVAAHSASCKVIGDPSTIQIGDRVQIKELPVRDSDVAIDSPVPVMPDSIIAPVPVVSRPKKMVTPLSGSLSIIAYSYNDNAVTNLDFTQATTRLSLKARRLWGKEITLSVRGRGRFDKRQREYRSDIQRQDWQNRLWELSIAYQEPTAVINLWAGRILPRRVGGVGYLDGLLLEGRLTDRFRAGLFGGSYPDWMYDDRRFSLMKAGGYLVYAAGSFGQLHVEQSLGASGEYHRGDVNREYLILQGRLGKGSLWGLNHTAELDINRDWRKIRSGKSTQLSSLFLNGWIRPGARVRFSVSYDTRTNYWTFESRSAVDSLFDDNLRQGVRFQTDLTLPAQSFISGSAGYRKRDGDADPTWSYSANLRKGNVFVSGLTLSAQYAGFDGPANRGYNYSLRASRLFTTRYTIGVGHGKYAYRTTTMSEYRTNDWIEVTGQADLSRRYWLGVQVQIDSGDDIDGTRVQSELGYRF